MLKIDSHQHFWNYSAEDYPWIDERMTILRQDYMPDNLLPILNAENVTGTVAVQARQSLEETQFLLSLATTNNFIKGIVGWVDLNSTMCASQLQTFLENPTFKGIRHIVQEEPKGFMSRPIFVENIGRLAQYNLTYDILIYEHQLNEATTLVEKFPKQTFILDHLGKPNIKEGLSKQWTSGIAQLAAHDNVYCKLSGLVTEAHWNSWSYNDLVVFLETVYKNFGSARLMYGSDWPVCLLSASYSQVLTIVTEFLMQLSLKEQEQIFALNAIKAYNLNV